MGFVTVHAARPAVCACEPVCAGPGLEAVSPDLPVPHALSKPTASLSDFSLFLCKGSA